MIERNADPLARHTVRMRSVVTDRDEEPASALVLTLAGEDERVCRECALRARCEMCPPDRRT